jgi:hypothetical protein
MMTAAARPMRPAKPTWTLLRAALGVALGEVAALVGVEARLVGAALLGARVLEGGAVAELMAEEMEAITELVEEEAAAEEEATEDTDADPAVDDPAGVEAGAEDEADPAAPRQPESELGRMVIGAEYAIAPVESRIWNVIDVPAGMFATQVKGLAVC